MIKIYIFAEQDFDTVVVRPTAEAARAFADGVCHGGALYGAGSCAAYVWPDDEHEMRALEKADQVEAALAKGAELDERSRGVDPAGLSDRGVAKGVTRDGE